MVVPSQTQNVQTVLFLVGSHAIKIGGRSGLSIMVVRNLAKVQA